MVLDMFTSPMRDHTSILDRRERVPTVLQACTMRTCTTADALPGAIHQRHSLINTLLNLRRIALRGVSSYVCLTCSPCPAKIKSWNKVGIVTMRERRAKARSYSRETQHCFLISRISPCPSITNPSTLSRGKRHSQQDPTQHQAWRRSRWDVLVLYARASCHAPTIPPQHVSLSQA